MARGFSHHVRTVLLAAAAIAAVLWMHGLAGHGSQHPAHPAAESSSVSHADSHAAHGPVPAPALQPAMEPGGHGSHLAHLCLIVLAGALGLLLVRGSRWPSKEQRTRWAAHAVRRFRRYRGPPAGLWPSLPLLGISRT